MSYRFLGLKEAGNWSKGTQLTQQTGERGVYTGKKLSFEYVSLKGKTEDLMELSNGDIDNLFPPQLSTHKADCDLKSVRFGTRDGK